MSALDLVHVGKNYGSSCVLSDISFSVTEGDFLGLLGHNGAGKSTLIEIIVGLVEKTSGRVAVFGKDLDREPLLAKSCIRFVSQDYNFNQFDTVMQVVVNQAGLYGIPYRTAVQRAKKYLDILQLSDRSKEQTRFLSGGMKKRMMLARAVIHQPKLLILDELTSGVDIEVRYLIWNFLRELNRSGTTIIMITHYLEEIEAPENYGTISFPYQITLTNDMAQVDYGHYIYYFSDTMQIKNWPLEGLIVEKQVDSDDAHDYDKYYTFRVSILNDDGSVNTDYNEKNGDDTFANGVVEFELKDKEQKMFWGFLKGTRYKVEELNTDGYAVSVTYSIFDGDGNISQTITVPGTFHSGTLTQDDEIVIFKNSKHEHGSLKIKKNVTVNGDSTDTTLADGEYKFTVTGPGGYSHEITLTIENGVSDEETLTDLVPGEYTVTEDTDSNPSGMSLVGDNGVKVTVVGGKNATVETVAMTNNRDLGKLTIKKNVTVNGAATTKTLADGTYHFTITGPDNYSALLCCQDDRDQERCK